MIGAAAPRRHHHGRQWPLGEGAAACRASPATAGRRGGPQGDPRAAGESGIECLTLYAFSSENWRRPEPRSRRPDGAAAPSISARELDELPPRGNVRLRIIGDLSRLRAGSRASWSRARWRAPPKTTRHDPRHRAQLRSQDEIVRAARALAARAAQARSPRKRSTKRRSRRRARHRRPAAARPADPHLRRTAAVQLPAVAGGLCGTAVRRHACGRISMATRLRAALATLPARERRFGGSMSQAERPARRLSCRLVGRRGDAMVAVLPRSSTAGSWPRPSDCWRRRR